MKTQTALLLVGLIVGSTLTYFALNQTKALVCGELGSKMEWSILQEVASSAKLEPVRTLVIREKSGFNIIRLLSNNDKDAIWILGNPNCLPKIKIFRPTGAEKNFRVKKQDLASFSTYDIINEETMAILQNSTAD